MFFFSVRHSPLLPLGTSNSFGHRVSRMWSVAFNVFSASCKNAWRPDVTENNVLRCSTRGELLCDCNESAFLAFIFDDLLRALSSRWRSLTSVFRLPPTSQKAPSLTGKLQEVCMNISTQLSLSLPLVGPSQPSRKGPQLRDSEADESNLGAADASQRAREVLGHEWQARGHERSEGLLAHCPHTAPLCVRVAHVPSIARLTLCTIRFPLCWTSMQQR